MAEVEHGKILKRLLLTAALTIVGVRPLVQETHDTARQPFADALTALPDMGPLPTLWINLAIVVIFGLTMALRYDGYLTRPRKSGLTFGVIGLVLAAGASCLVASNQRLAINATIDWLTLPLLAIALAHLLQKTWHMRLALCVIVASGVASAVESYDQVLVTFPNTIQMYEQDKQGLWHNAGMPPDAHQIKIFEKRIYGNAASGFFGLSNIAGNYFVLAFFSALALVAMCWRNKVTFVVALLPAVSIGGAMWLTRSRGALVATALGLTLTMLWAVASLRLKTWLQSHRQRLFKCGWLAVIAVILGSVGYGLTTGGLPGGSLTYRWWYVEDTAAMVADHPLLGVGSEHYGRHYTRYKGIRSPEEIVDPHNMFATAAASWGIPGFLGLVLMLLGGSRALVVGLRPEDPGRQAAPPPDEDVPGSAVILWVVMLALPVWTLRAVIVGNWDPDYILASNGYPLIGWVLACCVCLVAVRMQNLEPVVLLGAGLFAFLVHNLITFGLFVGGSATTCFALIGVGIAYRGEQGATVRDVTRLSAAPPPRTPLFFSLIFYTTCAVAVGCHLYVIRPVSQCWQSLQSARQEQISAAACVAGQSPYWKAMNQDPLDPTAARELVQRVLPILDRNAFTEPMYVGLKQAMALAIERDPENVSNYRLQASAHLLVNEVQQAIVSYERVLLLYPTNPDDHLRMAQLQKLLYESSGANEALERAIAELEVGLELDRSRPGEVELRRFQAAKVQQLEGELRRLQGLRSTP